MKIASVNQRQFQCTFGRDLPPRQCMGFHATWLRFWKKVAVNRIKYQQYIVSESRPNRREIATKIAVKNGLCERIGINKLGLQV